MLSTFEDVSLSGTSSHYSTINISLKYILWQKLSTMGHKCTKTSNVGRLLTRYMIKNNTNICYIKIWRNTIRNFGTYFEKFQKLNNYISCYLSLHTKNFFNEMASHSCISWFIIKWLQIISTYVFSIHEVQSSVQVPAMKPSSP